MPVLYAHDGLLTGENTHTAGRHYGMRLGIYVCVSNHWLVKAWSRNAG